MLRSRLITLKRQKQFVSYFMWICTYRLNPGNVLFHQEYSFLLASDTAQSIFMTPPFWNIWGAMRTSKKTTYINYWLKWDFKSFNTLRVVVCARQNVSSKHASSFFHNPFISSFCFVAVASLIQKEKPSNLGSFRLVLLRSSLSSPLVTLNFKQPEKCSEGNIFLSAEHPIWSVLESESQELW